jgi:hypothetical protein
LTRLLQGPQHLVGSGANPTRFKGILNKYKRREADDREKRHVEAQLDEGHTGFLPKPEEVRRSMMPRCFTTAAHLHDPR